jgi:uncharacterized membrane protein
VTSLALIAMRRVARKYDASGVERLAVLVRRCDAAGRGTDGACPGVCAEAMG